LAVLESGGGGGDGGGFLHQAAGQGRQGDGESELKYRSPSPGLGGAWLEPFLRGWAIFLQSTAIPFPVDWAHCRRLFFSACVGSRARC
jgi:hypothetical protein